MKTKIAITGMGSISPLGDNEKDIWNNYLASKTFFTQRNKSESNFWEAKINASLGKKITELQTHKAYEYLDRSVLLAMLAAEKALIQSKWNNQEEIGINFGSSRGATHLLEKYHEEFLTTQNTHTLTSPTTTLGNIASWVGQYTQINGPTFDHSMTCSTASFSILNAIAWLESGMANKMLVGGTEAPLTNFTLQQLKALRIYSQEIGEFPCQAGNLSKLHNTMILGEGANAFCLEKDTQNALAYIVGIGFATEPIKHPVAVSSDALALQKSMQKAIGNHALEDIDAIITHTPGTIKGDEAEYFAISNLFGNHKPFITNNKWKIGHTFGASGGFSLELAILMLKNQKYIPTPFCKEKTTKKSIQKILINTMGFGGNAVSILISN